MQGDVTRIFDRRGTLVAQYVYDAWGNHKVLNANGTEMTDETFIGNVNPFRYRGYYYDTDSGLYYLQSRYYDPEVGRFINADDIDYIEPETLMGCNLYAYCGNNPVMYVDPNGKFSWLAFFAVVGISALIGAIDGGITAAMSGQNFWLGFAAGAIGGAVGGAISMIPRLGMWGNLFGRVVSSGIYNITNEYFQTGTLSNMDWGIFTLDLVSDAVFSMVYLQGSQDVGIKIAKLIGGKLQNILNEVMPSMIAGFIDMFVDILQTGAWYNNRTQKRIKQRVF